MGLTMREVWIESGSPFTPDMFVSNKQPHERVHIPKYTFPAHLYSPEQQKTMKDLILELEEMVGFFGIDLSKLQSQAFKNLSERFAQMTNGVSLESVVRKMRSAVEPD